MECIGSADQRGLHHLVYELVCNNVDEAMAGHYARILCTILGDATTRVEANERGIPTDTHPITNISALETVMTTLHAGAKFGGDTYRVSGGLHGVGASVVNALSSWLKITVKRNGKTYEQEYREGIPRSRVNEVGEASDTGTIVQFIADENIFGRARFDFGIPSERLKELAYLNKGPEISLKDERTEREITCYSSL
ncbi:MAG: ATP-binding protein [Dehalococcoidia bacterium]|nr:ATP-binding protein [Dehalococcoidia bacterium]